MTETLRLHYAPDNASLVIRLVLEEMGLPYESVLIDRSVREQDGAAYRKLNPNGLIPVLETPQGPIFETAAILLWLADTYGQMAPAVNDPERGPFLKWLFFASNTLHADLRILFYPYVYIDPEQAETLRAGIRPRLHRHLQLLDSQAAAAPSWLSPDSPSVLTYYLACMLRWMAIYPSDGDQSWFRLTDTPYLQRMLGALEARDATQAAITAEGLGATPFTSPTHPTPPEGSAT
ncbi:glutathione S-transferase family protein [Ruegeria sp. 2205SS24-7]|uniref:glutathione S-transferase family protein n=1 Tax=Ruegeria discodermiae TaxID=3064389 RepID=UPI00274197DA|nr:glutathione S-transferase family protein [Ruegeria sp. 2205SS24-7]MDP5216807.1 glutathione S-transferase family protein [Ruegeria sp. 2205SS24-7]